jgi:esterase/lipase
MSPPPLDLTRCFNSGGVEKTDSRKTSFNLFFVINHFQALDFTTAHLADLAVPFQVMHGGSDRVTNPSASIALYNESRSPKKSLKIYPLVSPVLPLFFLSSFR